MPETPPARARAFVFVVTTAGLGLLAWCAASLAASPPESSTFVVVALLLAVVIGEQVPIRTGDGGEIAPSTTFMLAMLIAVGPAAAAIAQALASACGDVLGRKPASRVAFNAAQYTIAVSLAALPLELLTDLGHPMQFGADDVVGIVLAVATFYVANTGIVSTVIALHARTSLRRQFSGDLTFHSVTELILLGLAPITVLTLEHAPLLAPLLVLPLVGVHRAANHAQLNTHLAAHDGLTQLPNRMLFQDRTEQALERARRDGQFVAVMLLDLDRFKEINDTLGHHAGDAVLQDIGRRLAAAVGPGDTVARLGGDEFSVLVRSEPHAEGAIALAERLRARVLPPIEIGELRLSVDVSIGIAWAPDHGNDVHDLMQRADIAMYTAKRAGAGVAAYEPDDDAHSVERLALMDELREALGRGDMEVVFQPQVDLGTGAVVGAEALARWRRDGSGYVPPDRFIPLAEETGVIVPLTWHVLEEAVRHAASWRAEGLDLHVAVNLSARMLAREDLTARVVEACERHGLPAANLVLEVTESMVLHDPELASRTLERLAELGIVVSIDDFGTGYSSLDYLKRLPVAEVKIDRTFIMSMHVDPRDRAIVRGTLDLAHALGMRVVAEGVEDAALGEDLRGMGCELGQGYHYSMPIPAAEVPAAARRLAAAPAAAAAAA